MYVNWNTYDVRTLCDLTICRSKFIISLQISQSTRNLTFPWEQAYKYDRRVDRIFETGELRRWFYCLEGAFLTGLLGMVSFGHKPGEGRTSWGRCHTQAFILLSAMIMLHATLNLCISQSHFSLVNVGPTNTFQTWSRLQVTPYQLSWLIVVKFFNLPAT